MKYFLTLVLVNACCIFSFSQEPCDKLIVDFETGTLNGLDATVSMSEIKEALPCFTGETEENTNGLNCGGGVFYLNHYFNFYTGEDFIKIREKFQGDLSRPIYGVSIEKAQKEMGEPDGKFEHEDWLGNMNLYLQYQKNWGVLTLIIQDGNVKEIEMHHSKQIADIDYCL